MQSGKYPLWRFLYIYVNKAPGKPLDPLVAEFVKLIYSKEGQEVVVKDGYMPLSAAQAQAELAKVLEVAVHARAGGRMCRRPATWRPSMVLAPDQSVRDRMAPPAKRIGRLKRIDRAAVFVITLGGIAVVVGVLGHPAVHRGGGRSRCSGLRAWWRRRRPGSWQPA